MKTKNESLLEAFANQKHEIELSKIFGGGSWEPTTKRTYDLENCRDDQPDTKPDAEAIY